jgi:soluble lytic murein transglycosylase-like protein
MRTLIATLILTGGALLILAALPSETEVKMALGRDYSPQDLDNQWKAEQNAKRVQKAVLDARKLFHKVGCRRDYSELVGKYAVLEGLNARVAAALIYVESSCNPMADDHRGSHGLTQVNTHAHPYNKRQMQDPEQNIRAGFHILAGMIRKHGLVEGLHRYNGLGNPTNSYATKVLKAAGMEYAIQQQEKEKRVSKTLSKDV